MCVSVGKTKHFQTLEVTDSLMLCDCPGLVFPSFMNSTGEMICSGILPINQMRDYVDPASVSSSSSSSSGGLPSLSLSLSIYLDISVSFSITRTHTHTHENAYT